MADGYSTPPDRLKSTGSVALADLFPTMAAHRRKTDRCLKRKCCKLAMPRLIPRLMYDGQISTDSKDRCCNGWPRSTSIITINYDQPKSTMISRYQFSIRCRVTRSSADCSFCQFLLNIRNNVSIQGDFFNWFCPKKFKVLRMAKSLPKK